MEGYSQADILAALQRQSAAPPPPAKQYRDLARSDLHDENKVNTRKLYCPRDGCRAVIVQPGTCELVEGKPDVVSALSSALCWPRGLGRAALVLVWRVRARAQ